MLIVLTIFIDFLVRDILIRNKRDFILQGFLLKAEYFGVFSVHVMHYMCALSFVYGDYTLLSNVAYLS